MKYYAIADLHGRFDLLEKAMEKITEHALKNPTKDGSKIITLGDYVDRGPDSKKIIELLMKRQSDRFICLQGNHEALMVQSIAQKLSPDWWVGNGGDATLMSYGHPFSPFMMFAYDQVSYMDVPEDHLKWIASLPLYHEAEKQIFVHAGIPQWGMNLPLKSKQAHKIAEAEEKMQWMLYDKRDSGGWKGKHVVHGHHQFADGPHQWLDEKTGGRTDLDCWAYHTGRLIIGVFDDTQLHALEFIEVLTP